MVFEKVKTEGMRHEYRIVLEASEIEKRVVEAVSQRAKTYKMAGFRPGHVPLDVVRKNVETAVLPDIFEEMVNEACQAIVKEIGVTDIASSPTYKFEDSYKNGEDAKLTLFLETVPEFELKEFKGKIKKVVPLIRESDIEAAKKAFMEGNPVLKKAEKDYSIKRGDGVSLLAQYVVKGVVNKKKSFEHSMIVPQEFPAKVDFLNELVGRRAGESFEVGSTGSEDVTFRFCVNSVKKALLYPSFEEYAEARGLGSAEDLQNAIVKALEMNADGAAFVYHKQQVLNILAEEYDFALPKSVVEQEMKNVIARIRKELEREKARGEGDEENLQKTDEDFASEYEKLVERRVRLGYVLNKFAKKYGTTASDEEIKNAIIAEARMDPVHSKEIMKYYAKRRAAVEYLQAEIIETKVVRHLIDLAEGEKVEKTKDEIDKLVDEILEQEYTGPN